MNKLFQQLQQTGPLPSLKNNLSLIQDVLKNNSDPSSYIQNMILNNPKMKQLMNLFQSSGMTPKQFFYKYVQEHGIDPDQFLNS